jgi:hypothetical protein
MRLIQSEKISQGSIFNGAIVPGYEECCCYGIILTARCDLEHSKANIVNFLPVVEYCDWIERDCAQIFIKKAQNKHLKSLEEILKRNTIKEYIYKTYTYEDVCKCIEGRADREKFMHLSNEMVFLSTGIGEKCEKELLKKAVNILNKAERQGIIKDLIAQKLNGYYFLECVDYCVEHPSKGFVVLLRQILSLPREIALRLDLGIDFEELEEPASVQRYLSCRKESPICMITGQLRSPDIEHLCQVFAYLFTRVGIEDVKEELLTQHLDFIEEV